VARGVRWLLMAVVVVLILLTARAVWERANAAAHAAAPGQPPRVPVTVALASRQDMPVLPDGLGTVQAWNTSAIRSQVEGTPLRVEFTEGEEVKRGAVLVQIDRRFYQAALDRAQAKRVGMRRCSSARKRIWPGSSHWGRQLRQSSLDHT
jgi:multidrug efflux system membrane fusion protein